MASFHFTATSFRTLDSTSGNENLSPQAGNTSPCTLSVAENVRFTKDGGVANRPGYSEEADISTSASVDDITTLADYNVMFCKSGTAIKHSLNGTTWYDTGLTRTATAKEFLYPDGHDVYATNGTDAYTRIAVSKITAINSVAGTCSLDSGENFSSGTIYIRGIQVTGGTLSTNDFTGCTGLTAAMAIGDIVTQTSAPAGAPTGTCIAELEASALVGDSFSIKASVPRNDGEPELFYDFTGTGNTAKRMPSTVTDLKTGNQGTLVGMKGGITVATEFLAGTGLTDALITNTISTTHTVPNAHCIVDADRFFYVLTGEGRILPVINTDAGFQIIEDPNNPRNNFDYPIQGWVGKNKAKDDNTGNRLFYDPSRKELIATILTTKGITEDIICQTDIGSWSTDTTKSFGCRTILNGEVYAGSDSDDKIYKENYGFTDAGIPMTSRIVTGKFRLGRRGVTGDYLQLSFGGLLNPTGEFTFRVIADGQQVIQERVLAIDLQEKGLMTVEDNGIPLGNGVMGSETLGSAGSAAEVFQFEYPYEMMIEAENIQIEWEITDEGTSFQLNYFTLQGEHDNELLIPHV